MAKLPTYEEMAKNVAEKALDDVLYNGKSIREWMQIIVSEDCISRAQALSDYADWYGYGYRDNTFYKRLKDMSPVTPKPKTDVLDKIRAEIKEESRFCPLTEGLERALEIIDKYKAESEDKE